MSQKETIEELEERYANETQNLSLEQLEMVQKPKISDKIQKSCKLVFAHALWRLIQFKKEIPGYKPVT